MNLLRLRVYPRFQTTLKGFASVALMLFYSSTVSAADFQLMMDMRSGAEHYHQQRFSSAEELFVSVRNRMKNDPYRDNERYALVLEFLAQSKSLQGKNSDVTPLMEERLNISKTLHGEGSPHLAPMQAGVAEAYYRDGRVDDAIKMVRTSLQGLQQLGTDYQGYRVLATENLQRYQSGANLIAGLPSDLSDFYRRCDSIASGDSEADVKRKMQGTVELGVEYKPDGFIGKMFEMAAHGKDGSARQGEHYRRIFLPDTDEEVRTDLCVVDQRRGLVISTDYNVH